MPPGHFVRFRGKREGFFGGSGFLAETGNSFWHENEGGIVTFVGAK